MSSTQPEGAEKGEGAGPGLLEKIKKGVAEIEAVEARADEYLLKFGTSIGGFLRDAITIAPPEGEGGEEGEVVFEAAKEGGKKQILCVPPACTWSVILTVGGQHYPSRRATPSPAYQPCPLQVRSGGR